MLFQDLIPKNVFPFYKSSISAIKFKYNQLLILYFFILQKPRIDTQSLIRNKNFILEIKI